MCGRFTVTVDPAQLALEVDAQWQPAGPRQVAGRCRPLTPERVDLPHYNLAPTMSVPLLLEEEGARHLFPARWAFIPHWAKRATGGPVVFNARAETVRTKPFFRTAVRRLRGVVPASGWYEWQAIPGQSHTQPCYMHDPDGELYFFAAIASIWEDPESEQAILSTAVITTAAVGPLQLVHDRMPRLLTAAEAEVWMRPGPVPEELLAPVDPQRAGRVVIDPVGREVGSVRNNSPALITPMVVEERLF